MLIRNCCLFLLISIVFSSCYIHYRAFVISPANEISGTSKANTTFRLKGHKGTWKREFVFYLPQEACAETDTNKLRQYAELVFKKIYRKRNHQFADKSTVTMKSDSTWSFYYPGPRYRDVSISYIYDTSTCTIRYTRIVIGHF